MLNNEYHSSQPDLDNLAMPQIKNQPPSGYADRLTTALEEGQKSVRELADHVGISTQAIYKLLRGESRSLQVGHHLSASKFLQVEPLWLSDGRGSRHPRGPIALHNNPEYPSVPKVHFEFKAGETGYSIERLDDIDPTPVVIHVSWFQSHGYKPKRLVAVTVDCENMAPTLSRGDTAVINLDSTESISGEVFAVRIGDELRLERLFRADQSWSMRSDNPDVGKYPPLEMGSDTEIIGRVVYRQSDRL